jgi:hypothetical protein
MAPFDLSLREIEDMAKDASDRRAHGVQDSQRIGRNGGHLSKDFPAQHFSVQDFQGRFCRGERRSAHGEATMHRKNSQRINSLLG